MKFAVSAALALTLLASAAPLYAQDDEGGPRRGPPPMGPIQGPGFKATYVRLGNAGEGMLYEPASPSPKERIAIVFSHPGNNNFNAEIGPQMAMRGYRVVNINYRARDGNDEYTDVTLPTISAAVTYMHSLPGVEKVLVAGHSGGTHEMTLYDNVAEHGPSACNGPEKIGPCRTNRATNLAKPDGVILLDPPLGAFHSMSSIDPAVDPVTGKRDPALDMFLPANGYDPATKSGHYSAAFAKKFFAAQSARGNLYLNQAVARAKALADGKGEFVNDEPLVLRGQGLEANGARLYQPDTAFVSHTKAPHLLLKADGTDVVTIIHTVRPPEGQAARQLGVLGATNAETSVVKFLQHASIRTNPAEYAFTEDDITGVDWHSSIDSGPGNAEGVTVPTLVLTMTCHYLVVPGEIYFEHLAAKDKTYTAVEGATHGFSPCKPEYGNTTKRTFDYLDSWLAKPGRF